MAMLTITFNRLCIPIATNMTVKLQYLGVILDTNSNTLEARLPVDKLDRIREMLYKFKSKQSISKRALLSRLTYMFSTSCANVIHLGQIIIL